MPATSPAIVEREQESATLAQSIAAAGDGQGHLVLIDGPAGIGKTRLLAEMRQQAAPSMTVLWARASELERDYPFGVVRQLFEALVSGSGPGAAALAGAAEAARPVFVSTVFGSQAAGPDDSGSFAVLHGLYWLSLNLAEQQPLLLAVDDLQWADRQSLRFLAYLAHRMEGERMLIAATRRSSDPGTDPAVLADIAHDPLAVLVHPRPLSARAVRELVQARLGADADPSFCDECHVATGGNPLLLRQLLTALEADGIRPTAAQTRLVSDIGARAVSRSVLPRLSRLPDQTRAVARAVAVLGEAASLPAVAALAGADETRAAQATAELARAEILDREPPLRFVHPLVRDAVYEELSPAERQLEHARAATLLRERGAPEDQVATQLLNAPARGTAWVADLLHSAGQAARRKGAADSAVAYLRRALAEPPPPDLRPRMLTELGLAETLTDAPQAIEHLTAAYAAADDPLERVSIALELARLWCFSPTPQRALEVTREAAALVPPGHDDALMRLEAMKHFASIHFGVADLALARELERYRDGVSAPGPGARMLEAMTAFVWMLQCGPADRCAALALRALRGGELVAVDESFLIIAAMSVLIAADREEAMTMWDTIRAAAHRRGSLFSALAVNLWSGFTLSRRGDLTGAEPLMRQADRGMQLWGVLGPVGRAYAWGMLTEVIVERGDLPAARAILAEAAPTEGPSEGENHLRRARAEYALASGDTDAALAAAEDYAEHGRYILNPAWSGWRSQRALALRRAGRAADALADAAGEVELARRFGAPPGARALAAHPGPRQSRRRRRPPARGGRCPGRQPGPARICASTSRPGLGAAAVGPARRGTRAAAAGPRPGHGVRRGRPRAARARRALRGRRAPARRGAARRGVAHAQRTAGGRHGGGRHREQGHRPDAVRDAQDRRAAPVERLP